MPYLNFISFFVSLVIGLMILAHTSMILDKVDSAIQSMFQILWRGHFEYSCNALGKWFVTSLGD